MQYFSLILSVAAVAFCWMPAWSMFVSVPAIILCTVMFYRYYVSEKKDTYKEGRGIVFTAFVLSIVGFLGSIIMTGVPMAIYLMSSSVK